MLTLKMKRAQLIILLVFLLGLSNGSEALRIVANGVHFARSTSFQLTGIVRDRQLNLITSLSYRLGEGFLRSAYSRRPAFAPLVTGLLPDHGQNTGRIDLAELTGANFVAGAAVRLSRTGQPDIIATGVTVVTAGKITCQFDLTGAVGGAWNVTVTNPDGRSGTLPAAFRLSYAAPVVTAVAPGRGDNTGRIELVLSGENFRGGAVVALLKSGESDILGENVALNAATRLTCVLNLTGRAIGNWDVRVVNDDGQAAILPAAFKVQAATLAVSGPIVFASHEDPTMPTVKGANINYALTRDAKITLHIYNMRGERVWSQIYPAGAAGGLAGQNSVIWNGLTAFNNIAGAGVYLVHLVGQVDGQETILAREKLGIVK